jgi:hypothetical protein
MKGEVFQLIPYVEIRTIPGLNIETHSASSGQALGHPPS